MKNIIRQVLRLPIRWKLTIWSALVICVIILSYNLVQFFVLNSWLQQYEVQLIQSSMDDIQGYYHTEKGSVWNRQEIQASKVFLDQAVEKNEMIRILDQNGQTLISASHGIPANWIRPQTATQTEQFSVFHHDERLLVERAPLITSSFTGTVEIVRNVESLDDLVKLILSFVLAGAVVGIVLAALGGFFLSRKLLEPVKTLTATMKTIRGEGLNERVPVVDNGDELSDLTAIFNEMMDRVETSFLQQKQFIEDASHELRTPLAILEGHLSLLKRWGKHDPEILEESLEAVTQETTRLQGLVKELLDLTRAESLQVTATKTTFVRDVVQHVVYNLEVLYPDFVFELHPKELEPLQIAVKPEHLEQILLIILDNAIKYSNVKKQVDLDVHQADNFCVIQVVDYGEGIPAQELLHIFDRFYRVDKARSRKVGGNGLGLSIAQRLMTAYKGTIRVESEEGVGTKVELRFPLA